MIYVWSARIPRGPEIRKTRPCVVISPDEMNRHIRTVIIAPMTSMRRDGLLCRPAEEIKSAISAPSEEDYIRLREWFSEKGRERWDKEIEEDSSSGKLDFPMEEAGTVSKSA